jgi:hypothetical protein
LAIVLLLILIFAAPGHAWHKRKHPQGLRGNSPDVQGGRGKAQGRASLILHDTHGPPARERRSTGERLKANG